MRGASGEELRGGVCIDLSPAVIDKYFMSDGNRERFQHMTAKAMCGRCAVRAVCLEEAIIAPPGHGIRGGESNGSLWELHGEWMKGQVEADALAVAALKRQRPFGGLRTSQVLPTGRFEDVPLAYPDLGGEASA